MTVKLHNTLQPRLGKLPRPRQNITISLSEDWRSESDEYIKKYFKWHYYCESVKITR